MLFSEAGVPSSHWLFPLIAIGVLLFLLLAMFVMSYINHHNYRDLIEDEIKRTQSENNKPTLLKKSSH